MISSFRERAGLATRSAARIEDTPIGGGTEYLGEYGEFAGEAGGPVNGPVVQRGGPGCVEQTGRG